MRKFLLYLVIFLCNATAISAVNAAQNADDCYASMSYYAHSAVDQERYVLAYWFRSFGIDHAMQFDEKNKKVTIQGGCYFLNKDTNLWALLKFKLDQQILQFYNGGESLFKDSAIEICQFNTTTHAILYDTCS